MKKTGKCPHCGAETVKGTQIKQYYCLNCGAALDEERKRKEAVWRKRGEQNVGSPSSTFSGKLFSGLKGFSDKAKDILRDKTRDICVGLQSYGIDAQTVTPEQPEELISDTPPSWHWLGGSTYTSPSVMIVISEGSIRWIHLKEQTITTTEGESTSVLYVHYGVPTPKTIAALPKMKIETILKRSFPLLGKVKDIRWKGKDSRLGIVDCLNKDITLRGKLAKRGNDVSIRSHPDHSCWTITERCGERSFGRQSTWLPTKELWDCYQTIARYLLTE